MNSLLTKIRDKHALWYKVTIYLFCVITCTYFLPKEKSQILIPLQVGDKWNYNDVVASVDFVVKKTDDEITKENVLHNKHIPYYKKLNINYSDLLLNDTLFDENKIKSTIHTLDSLYLIGVYDKLNNVKNDSVLYLVINSVVTQIHAKQLLSVTKVKQLLNYKLPEKYFTQIVQPNIVYDTLLSNQINSEEEINSNVFKSKINKGEILVRKNDIVTENQIQIINSYRQSLKETENKELIYTKIAGQFITCAVLFGIMMFFLAFFRKPIFSQNTQITFIFMIMTLVIITSSILSKYNPQYVYAIPFCLVPIIIRVFFDSRTSLFTFLIITLICAFFVPDKFEFVFVQLIAGIGNIFSVADMGKRSKLFVSAVLTFIYYIVTYTAYHLINDTQQVLMDLYVLRPFIISSSCVLFSFPLIYVFEKLFGFVSDFTLLELCDLNSPLLRLMSQKTPGTFQHSLQVANLAEEACYKIGGNPLLVRTGAMYHDIGKMNNARFFTENQVGEVSPHEDLSSEESAQIIIGHVIRGIEIAKENKLPEIIIDFIRTHHGTTTTKYFLNNYKKENVGKVINEDLFRYPGPIPFSKETAILMMADGVEASSRSLKKYDAITIDELVDRIINHLISENQFMNSDITFRDIKEVKKIFKKRLMNIYHVRIEYPR